MQLLHPQQKEVCLHQKIDLSRAGIRKSDWSYFILKRYGCLVQDSFSCHKLVLIKCHILERLISRTYFTRNQRLKRAWITPVGSYFSSCQFINFCDFADKFWWTFEILAKKLYLKIILMFAVIWERKSCSAWGRHRWNDNELCQFFKSKKKNTRILAIFCWKLAWNL